MNYQVLSKYECHDKQLYLALSKERHVIVCGVYHLMLEKSSMFNSFLNLENLLSSSGLMKISAVDHRCQYSQCICHPFVDGPL